jgi:hypothetical protein
MLAGSAPRQSRVLDRELNHDIVLPKAYRADAHHQLVIF